MKSVPDMTDTERAAWLHAKLHDIANLMTPIVVHGRILQSVLGEHGMETIGSLNRSVNALRFLVQKWEEAQ